jgi:hypothetical protein
MRKPVPGCEKISTMFYINLRIIFVWRKEIIGEAQQIRVLIREIELLEDEEICGAFVLGYAVKPEIKPLPLTGNPVTYIR